MSKFVIEYKHCIAYAKALSYIGTILYDETYIEKHTLTNENDVYYFRDDNGFNVHTGLYYRTDSICRVGCFGALDTHCLSLVKECAIIFLDGENFMKIHVHELDDSEERFFQNSLVLDRANSFYFTVFSYLHKNCPNDFSLEDNMHYVMKQCEFIRDELSHMDYFTDLMDLVNNADEYLIP